MFLHIGQDFRFAVRTLIKDRGFFAVAILALGLGIGSTTAIFSVLYNAVIDPFPYVDGGRIVDIEIHDLARAGQPPRNSFTIPEFLEYQRQSRSFDRTLGVWEQSMVLGKADSPELLDTDAVTGNTFQFLGVAPLLGRGIEPSDARADAPPVFVLSYKVWKRRFGLDPSIVGKEFLLDGKPTTLIGIMPQRFAFWGGDIWIPTGVDPSEPGAAKRRLVLYGHLKPGVRVKTAEAELMVLANRLSKQYRVEYPEKFEIHLGTMTEFMADRIQATLYTLIAAVGLLLLIACANVANLLLARAATRKREFILRMTLGAGRARLIAQLMVESLVLAISGAGLGCLLASFGLQGLVAMVPVYTFPDEAAIELNTPVLLATIAIAVLTAFLFGLAPALAASRNQEFSESLNAGSRGNSGFGDRRKRSFLIASEVALAILLLSSAGLLMRSFLLERGVDLGIRTDHVLTTQLAFPPKRFPTPDSQSRYVKELLTRLNRFPGIVSAAATTTLPPNAGLSTDIDVPGTSHQEKWRGYLTACSTEIFRTLGTRLIAGRTLSDDDQAHRRNVAVVNESLAHRIFDRQNPIGRQLSVKAMGAIGGESSQGNMLEIVGVVSNVNNEGIRKPSAPEAYVPYTTAPGFGAYAILVRTSVPPATLGPALEREALSVDRSVVPQQTMTLDGFLDLVAYARPRFGMILLSCFAGIGLILVSLGVYSVVSYNVVEQRHEMGIRIAIGADPKSISSLVLGRSLRVIAFGVAAGLALTVIAGRALASQIWGVAWYDPLTLVAVIAVMIGVGALASLAPSWRAARVDPAALLRHD